ncbi:MAG: GIY-YIG nuclease family protein [Lachnospira pectinoschiza]
MAQPNYRKIYAIKKMNEKRILDACPNMEHKSGIYFYTRTDENGISYFYIGQSVDCLERSISHLTGYQHIDLSIKKRGFYSENNPYGWKLNVMYYPKDKLDEMEQYWILEYTKRGYQCRYNKTAGGQGEGKEKINEFKPSKGYRDGIQQGKKVLARELSSIAEKHLKLNESG